MSIIFNTRPIETIDDFQPKTEEEDAFLFGTGPEEERVEALVEFDLDHLQHVRILDHIWSQFGR